MDIHIDSQRYLYKAPLVIRPIEGTTLLYLAISKVASKRLNFIPWMP
jgi:hypothetical protein